MKAEWNGEVIAESDSTIVVEGNQYFPPDSIRREYLQHSSTTTVCSWKGTAHYYNVVVAGKENRDAAWYYPNPKEAAADIKNHVAFWRGISVQES
jgi:uncharacterized protein (DUF427 family)